MWILWSEIKIWRRRFRINTKVRCVWAHPPFGSLSRRGLNQIKPVYDPDRPDGRLNLTASAFNQLGQYTSSPGRRGYWYAELAENRYWQRNKNNQETEDTK